LIVFVKSKTENQLIRFVIAYLVAHNNVKHETVAATRDPSLHHSRPTGPPNSPDFNSVDYRIWGVLQNCFIRNLLKIERWWTEVASHWKIDIL